MKRRFKRILSVSKPSSDIFRFFDLPPEIRDHIYDYLAPEKQWETASVISWPLVNGPTHTRSPDQKFQRAHIEHKRNLPCKKYLLINRQIRHELLRLVLQDAWLAIKFFVDADTPPLLSDKVLKRTIARHVRRCKLQFSYRNLLGKLRPGHSDAERYRREEKISCHLGIAINGVVRQMPSLEICTYQLVTNFDFAFNIHHDYITAASAHFMDQGCLRELVPAKKSRKSFIELVERKKSEDSSANMSLKDK